MGATVGVGAEPDQAPSRFSDREHAAALFDPSPRGRSFSPLKRPSARYNADYGMQPTAQPATLQPSGARGQLSADVTDFRRFGPTTQMNLRQSAQSADAFIAEPNRGARNERRGTRERREKTMNTEESTVVDQKAVSSQESAIRGRRLGKDAHPEKSPVVDQKTETANRLSAFGSPLFPRPQPPVPSP